MHQIVHVDLAIINRTFHGSMALHGLPGGGHSTFFQVGVSGPDFRSVGLAN